ncbi:g2905 [Coccomyxa elongata]
MEADQIGIRQQRSLPTTPESASPVLNFWRDFLANSELIDNLDKIDFNNLTPIQAAAVPMLTRGLDCMVIGGHGTGKTLAALISLLDHVDVSKGNGPAGLIMAPAGQVEELAKQIRSLLSNMQISCMSGSMLPWYDEEYLFPDVQVLVAQPCGVRALLKQDKARFQAVSAIFIDAADLLYIHGHGEDLRQCLMHLLPSCTRHVVMTCSSSPSLDLTLVHQLAKEFCPDIIKIHKETFLSADIIQVAKVMPDQETLLCIGDILYRMDPDSRLLIVICKFQLIHLVQGVLAVKQDRIAFKTLTHRQTLNTRKGILEKFAAGRFSVLLSTDIAARDIFIKNIEKVLIIGTPDNANDYQWLCSRAGWLGSAGKAVTFVAPAELSLMVKISEELKSTGLPVPIIQRLEDKSVQEQAHAGQAVKNAEPEPNNSTSQAVEDAADSLPKTDTSQGKPEDEVKEQPSTCSPEKSGWEPLLERVSPSAAEAPPPPTTSTVGNAAHKLAEGDVLNQQEQKRKFGTSSIN